MHIPPNEVRGPSSTIQFVVKAPRKVVFSYITAEDVLPKVLTGYGLLPGVVSTSGNTGPWDRPGSIRVVHLKDGSTAQEEVTSFQSPHYFAYRISKCTFALKHFADFAKGEWWFEELGEQTKVCWRYSFHSKHLLTKPILALFVRLQWRGYMKVCQNHVIQDLAN